MNKDIYIIKNDINDKVYIGQAVDVKTRFQGHCKPSSIKREIIARAIQKYGKEHFWYEILEKSVSNYNDREKYWIDYYQSIVPNGYNIMAGGEEPPTFKSINHPESIFTKKTLSELINDLMFTSLSFRELGKKYKTTSTTINEIDKGKVYYNEKLDYPIRKQVNNIGKLYEYDVNEIIKLLQTTYKSFEEIGKQFNVEASAIARINKGMWHKRSNINYPIRNFKNTSSSPCFTYEQVTEIIDLIKNTKISLNKIAKRYNVAVNVIMGIKNGTTKMYRRKEYEYPLRSNN